VLDSLQALNGPAAGRTAPEGLAPVGKLRRDLERLAGLLDEGDAEALALLDAVEGDVESSRREAMLGALARLVRSFDFVAAAAEARRLLAANPLNPPPHPQ
jgi:hypothetical protein